MRAIEDINLGRSHCFMDDGYSHQILAIKRPMNSYLVKTLKPYGSDVIELTKLHCKTNFFESIS